MNSLFDLAALQSPFYENRLNLYLLTKKIERGSYPPLPSNVYSSKLRQVVSNCLQPIPDDRPDVEYVYGVALDMTASTPAPPSAVSIAAAPT
ncbi:hypothetical protein GE061_008996 [Apolygus lucorum]|uniref:Serine-threonine/tyrosine-protein kinase catalytic domain-containing protein n=1 Tax=Apolygus lucorum TaxID=248454 RepID=A0A6A4JXY5_APOLU|nr:hypothetical protein GE061_008996 [Apolygus lucorum]